MVFNSKTIQVADVAGLNDIVGLPVISETCGTCHNTPNVGNQSVAGTMDIGPADLKSSLSATYLPIITLRNRFTGETVPPTPAERFHIGLTDQEKSDLLQFLSAL